MTATESQPGHRLIPESGIFDNRPDGIALREDRGKRLKVLSLKPSGGQSFSKTGGVWKITLREMQMMESWLGSVRAPLRHSQSNSYDIFVLVCFGIYLPVFLKK
jgi:hypothetical protein